MNTRRRITLAVTALAVSGVSAGIAVAGTASAAGTGTCTDTVNVRSEPATDAPIVGKCEKGQSTRIGETRNGFVALDEFGGWASAKYVKAGSASEGRTAPNRADNTDGTNGTTDRGNGTGTNGDSANGRGTTGNGSTGTDSDERGTGSNDGNGTDRNSEPRTPSLIGQGGNGSDRGAGNADDRGTAGTSER